MRGKCILCGAKLPKKVLIHCANMPAGAQEMPDADQLHEDSGIDLNLHQCEMCGLVQFDCEPVAYYRDVIRAGGYSTTMTKLRRQEYTRFIRNCSLAGKKVVEVGCGQGEFLQVLTEFPVQAYGIEHRAALVEIARSKGLNVVQGFTEAAETVLPGGPFDAFLSFNFLEHQPYPNRMLQCIWNNLMPDGYGLITVPSFEYILENSSFYELLRDHIANYTKESLQFLLEKNGFSVLACRRVNRDTWEMTVQKRQRIDISGIQKNFDILKSQAMEFVGRRVEQGKKVAIWGASHQGFTLISTTGIQKGISYIIDSAPFKQGKYSPASHLPIVSPEYFFTEPVDTILIVAPGYSDEISDTIHARYGRGVEIAVLKREKIELLCKA